MSEEPRVANREYTSTVAHLSPLDIRIWEEGELINRGMEAYEGYFDEPFWLLEGNDVVFEAGWLAASPVTGAWDYHWRLEAYGNAAAYELEAYGTVYQELSWNAPVREGWYAIYLKAEDTEDAVNYYEVDSVFQLLPATGWTPFATMRSVQGMGAALPGAAAQGAEAFSNVANGNLLARCGVYAPDANAVGVPWDLTLAYNSQLPTRSEGKHPTEDLFGQSWHCAAFPRVEINPQNYFDLPHHLIVKALDSSGHPRLFHRRADGSFTRPRGIFEDCLRWGSGWALWKHDGSLWIFDAEGKLEAQYQWGGRSWHAYEYSGGQIRIQDNYNRVVMLQRDEDGRVVCLTDSQAPQAVTYFQYTSGGRLQRAKDGLGNTTQFSYVADGDIARLQWVKDAEGGITYFSVREYDTPVDARVYGFAGELQDTTDAEGYPTYYTYEALDAYGSERKTAVLNARTYAFEYETEGLVTRKLASPLGRVTYFRFDSKTYLTEEVTDAEGYGWQYTYDDDGCVTEFATPLDSTPSWGYLSRRVLPLTGVDFGSPPKLGGGYVMGHYGPRGDGVPGSYYGDYPWINIGYKNVLVRATNAEGHTWQSELNDFGDVIRREDALQNADVYERHFLGMCEMWTDRELRVWQYRYDDTTALIGTTDPEGYESTFDYQGHERVRTVDPAQAAWETDYLDNGWVQRSRDPLNHETLNAYNTVGRTTQTTDPRGNAAAFEYTARQLPSEATDRSGQTTEALYDPIGLTYETVDEKGYSTQRAHDPDNRVECVEDAEGHLTYYEYDQNGRLVKTTGARGYEWLTYYDPDGRAVKSVDPLGAATYYEYDRDGRLLVQTDPNGNSTYYDYDASDRPTSETDALSRVATTHYDERGQVDYTIDARERRIDYTYDKLDRRTKRTYPDEFELTFDYDENSNRTQMVDRHGTTYWTYNERNALIRRERPSDMTTCYHFDADGRRTVLIDPEAGATYYEYDEANRTTAVTSPFGDTTYFHYLANGLRDYMELANGVTTYFAYDTGNRITKITHLCVADQAVLQSFAYEYDPNSNRTKQTFSDGSYRRYTYSARSVDRLEAENVYDTEAELDYALDFRYDLAGNRTHWIRQPAESGNVSETHYYEYDEANELT